MAALLPSLRDPHCGNLVNPRRGLTLNTSWGVRYFCSEACRRHFRQEQA
jgi:YHS domain-containing protein